MSHIRDIKQRFSFTPAQLEIIRSVLEPIVNNPPKRNDYRDIVKLDVYLEETLRKVYLGIKLPERIPVADVDRVRSKPVNRDNLGFSEEELASVGSNSGSRGNGNNSGNNPNVVGFETFEDALAASDFADEDEMMASILGVSVEEYKAGKNDSSSSNINESK